MGGEAEGGGEGRKERREKEESIEDIVRSELWGIRGRGALFSGRPFGGDGSERRGTVGSFEVGRYRV